MGGEPREESGCIDSGGREGLDSEEQAGKSFRPNAHWRGTIALPVYFISHRLQSASIMVDWTCLDDQWSHNTYTTPF